MSEFVNYFGNTEPMTVDESDISNIWPVTREEQSAKTCKAYGLMHSIDNYYSVRKYITEGDLRDIFEMKSEVSNPYRFYDGDRDIYRTYLLTRLEDRRQKLAQYKKEVRQIEEALKELE